MERIRFSSMAYFILMLVTLTIGGLLFGKADTKRSILKEVGLDLSESTYIKQKQREYKKECIKALENAIKYYDYQAHNEKELLTYIASALYHAQYRDAEGDTISLGVKRRYVEFAETVVKRRQQDLYKNGTSAKRIITSNDFTSKRISELYIRKMWEIYQYPWPNNWLQEELD